jgi:hypothetical protein
MRFLWLTLSGLLLALPRLTAQVTVEVVLEQDQFLRDESLPIRVRISNRSGQTLHLGAEPDWLTFSIEGIEGTRALKLGDAPVPGEFSLESSLMADRLVDLMPYFDLSRPGRYRVTAVLKIKQWNEELGSLPKTFDIIRGAKIWEQEVGVPTKEGQPEVRRYALQQASYLKQLKLYLRLTDDTENKVFRVFPLGPLVSFGRPEAQIDKESQLHVLFQTGARSFNYSVISPDGTLLVRQTHDFTQTRPVLKIGDEGRIHVAGGVRRPTRYDLPPPLAAVSTNDVKSPKP